MRRILLPLLVVMMVTGCSYLPKLRGTPNSYLQLSDDVLWKQAINHDIGACYIEDARFDNGACRYYLKIEDAKWFGQGWPVDPVTGNGSGCFIPSEASTKHIGPTPQEYSLAMKGLRQAIADPANPCRLITLKMKTEESKALAPKVKSPVVPVCSPDKAGTCPTAP